MRRTLLCWHHCFKFRQTTDCGIEMAMLERVAEHLLQSSFVDLGTGTLGSSMYLLYFLMWCPSFIKKIRVKEDCNRIQNCDWLVFNFSSLPWTQLIWWLLSLCFFDNVRHKLCICGTINSCRLFPHRVSSHHYLYHRRRRLHLALIFECTFNRLIVRVLSYFFSQLFCLI